ncbi:MAG: hypothetical protein GDA48_27150 [Hormoscilla sp. GM102CHS1]|nr:hypothetical protein [Hormoscilla sp. GM102CHS1]
MTRQYVQRTNQSPQKETKDSSILQRTAVRSLPAKTLKVQTESQAIGSEPIKQDLTQIPVSHNDTPEVQPKLMVGSRGRSSDSGKQRMPVQAKLAIGQPDDRYEREADRVAKQVVQQLQGPANYSRTRKPRSGRGIAKETNKPNTRLASSAHNSALHRNQKRI